MAFGFTPKFEQELDLNGLDPKQYIVAALDAVKDLNWEINYTSKSGFIGVRENMWGTTTFELKVVVINGKVYISSTTLGRGMYDWGKNKKNVEAFISKVEGVITSLTDEQLNEKIADMSATFNSTEEDVLSLPSPTAAQNFKSFFSLFVPRTGYFVTPIIIDINLLVFIMMLMSGANFMMPDNAYLIAWGANIRALTLEGQWWRLITCTFVHIGIFHLLLNMYALVYIGVLLEPHLGKLRFAVAYLLTGILASLASIYWHDFTVSAGASGAIFGMYGVFFSLLTTNFIDKKIRKSLLTSISVFVVLNLVNGMKDGIDNAAHIGGVLSGFIMGYIFYPGLLKPAAKGLQYGTVLVLTITTVVITFVCCKEIPDDYGKYQALMKSFDQNEEQALKLYKMPQSSSKEEILSVVQNPGLLYWNENLRVLAKVDKLDLPISIVERDYKLKQYCNLRIKSYNFIYKQISENTKIYQDSIQKYNQQITDVINDLKSNSN